MPWILFVIACHDLGKACPCFQYKNGGPKHIIEADEKAPIGLNLRVPHGFVSQTALSEFLIENNWPLDLADKVADAVGCHHGERASPACLNDLEGDRWITSASAGNLGIPHASGDEPSSFETREGAASVFPTQARMNRFFFIFS